MLLTQRYKIHMTQAKATNNKPILVWICGPLGHSPGAFGLQAPHAFARPVTIGTAYS